VNWRMVEPVDLFPSHVHVTQARERTVGDVTQRIERVMIQPTDAYEYPGWRMVEIRGGRPTIIGVESYLRNARATMDRRAQ
jgi:hypothetical protein